jgi:catechol 2,3-dioxygenase-like lactoylglutathione lyase family enzyme
MEFSFEGTTLHVNDVEKSLEFYKRVPGAVVQAHRPGTFALLQIGKARLGLLGVGGPPGSST